MCSSDLPHRPGLDPFGAEGELDDPAARLGDRLGHLLAPLEVAEEEEEPAAARAAADDDHVIVLSHCSIVEARGPEVITRGR